MDTVAAFYRGRADLEVGHAHIRRRDGDFDVESVAISAGLKRYRSV